MSNRVTRPHRVTRRVAVGAVAMTGFILAGCATAKQDTLKAEGVQAHRIRNLAVWIGPIAIAVGIIVGAVVLFVILRFRDRGDGFVPKQTHGNTKLEILWTIAPAVLLAAISVPTVTTVFKLAEQPKNPIEITVVGQQWWWEFDYPSDGIVTANELVIPAGRDIALKIQSRDVIHSFWLPRLNGKKDAVPGRTHSLTLHADHPGDYWGQCTEFCGLSHANMRIRGRVLSTEDYAKWIENQKKDRVAPAVASAQDRGQEVYKAKCSSCHQINGVTTTDKNGQQQRIVVDASASLISGAAPNLTHFASRSVFAGGTFPLYLDDPATKNVNEADPYGGGALIPNKQQLAAWLRNPSKEVPMAPEGKRGMPNLKLTEAEIRDLSDYLLSLK